MRGLPTVLAALIRVARALQCVEDALEAVLDVVPETINVGSLYLNRR